MIIGLNGDAGAGKDTAARILIERYGFHRLAFADSLKLAAQNIFSLTDEQVWGALKDTEDPFWGQTPRVILQKLGTECVRRGYGDDVWVRSLFRKVEPGHDYVITDVRFENEAEEVVRWGGRVFRVVRDGHNSRIGHVSETALDEWAQPRGWLQRLLRRPPRWPERMIIRNNGSVADLGMEVITKCLSGGAVR